MSLEEFNSLIDAFIGGLPITLAVPRLLLLMRHVVTDNADAQDAMREACGAWDRPDDEFWDFQP